MNLTRPGIGRFIAGSLIAGSIAWGVACSDDGGSTCSADGCVDASTVAHFDASGSPGELGPEGGDLQHDSSAGGDAADSGSNGGTAVPIATSLPYPWHMAVGGGDLSSVPHRSHHQCHSCQ